VTGADLVRTARFDLGLQYELGRPLCMNELARLIGLKDGPGNMIKKIEAGRANMSGPVEVTIRMLLEGHRSPRHDAAFKPGYVARASRPRPPKAA
jgi:hypothetical protein